MAQLPEHYRTDAKMKKVTRQQCMTCGPLASKETCLLEPSCLDCWELHYALDHHLIESSTEGWRVTTEGMLRYTVPMANIVEMSALPPSTPCRICGEPSTFVWRVCQACDTLWNEIRPTEAGRISLPDRSRTRWAVVAASACSGTRTDGARQPA
jgi:hypothetical protein